VNTKGAENLLVGHPAKNAADFRVAGCQAVRLRHGFSTEFLTRNDGRSGNESGKMPAAASAMVA
jgi:hypothetical protein